METTSVLKSLIEKIPSAEIEQLEFRSGSKENIVRLNQDSIYSTAKLAFHFPSLQLDVLDMIVGDRQGSRIQLTYFTRSSELGREAVFRSMVDPDKPVPSVHSVWGAARLHEHEISEIFGLKFLDIQFGYKMIQINPTLTRDIDGTANRDA